MSIRLVCATDAACEGLNVQGLGAQVMLTRRGIRHGWSSERAAAAGLTALVVLSASPGPFGSDQPTVTRSPTISPW
jgi:hypothetical protein